MPCWIAIGYDTALRFSDLLHLNRKNYNNGAIRVVARKTGKPTVRKLSQYAISVTDSLLSKSPTDELFLWCVTRRRMLLKWKHFLTEHGIPGSSRWLRRSAATYVERISPGAAPRFLSHSNPDLAKYHYIDETLLAPVAQPPALR